MFVTYVMHLVKELMSLWNRTINNTSDENSLIISFYSFHVWGSLFYVLMVMMLLCLEVVIFTLAWEMLELLQLQHFQRKIVVLTFTIRNQKKIKQNSQIILYFMHSTSSTFVLSLKNSKDNIHRFQEIWNNQRLHIQLSSIT